MSDDSEGRRKDVTLFGLPDRDGNVPAIRFTPEGPVRGMLSQTPVGPEPELVHVTRDGSSPLGEVETVHSGKGPAMVNSDVFRSGWEAVFGKKEAGPPN